MYYEPSESLYGEGTAEELTEVLETELQKAGSRRSSGRNKMKKGYAPAVVLLAGILWGTLGLFSRHLKAAGFGPFEITFVRVSISFLATVIPVALFARALLVVHLRDLWCFLGSGIVSVLFFFGVLFQGIGIDKSRGGNGAAVHGTDLCRAAECADLSRSDHKEEVGGARTCVRRVYSSGRYRRGAAVVFQRLFVLPRSRLFYSLYSIFGKLAMQRGYSALTLTLYSFLFCTLGSAVMVDWNMFGSAVRQDSNILWWMLGTGLIAAFCPYTLYSIGLSKMDAGKASILVSIELVAEATIGFLVFHEPLSVVSIAGIMLVLSAIVILNLHSHKSRKTRK